MRVRIFKHCARGRHVCGDAAHVLAIQHVCSASEQRPHESVGRYVPRTVNITTAISIARGVVSAIVIIKRGCRFHTQGDDGERMEGMGRSGVLHGHFFSVLPYAGLPRLAVVAT